MCEVGTLKELNVKPGDVVFMHDVRKEYTIAENAHKSPGEVKTTIGFHYDWRVATIISRASDTPKLWRDMTPEEKGALLLAWHEGKVIEYFSNGDWLFIEEPTWQPHYTYRVRPEPKIETHKHVVFAHGERRLTEYKTVGGKVDWSSFKVVE